MRGKRAAENTKHNTAWLIHFLLQITKVIVTTKRLRGTKYYLNFDRNRANKCTQESCFRDAPNNTLN